MNADICIDNADYLENLYQQYLTSPQELTQSWQEYFLRLEKQQAKLTSVVSDSDSKMIDDCTQIQIYLNELVAYYRKYGHMYASLDPLKLMHYDNKELDLLKSRLSSYLNQHFAVNIGATLQNMRLKDIITFFEDIYCSNTAFELSHITNAVEYNWLIKFIETKRCMLNDDEKNRILHKLSAAEAFERFLQTKYIGQKRFSLEGAEAFIPLLDKIISSAANVAIRDIYVGMAHRGRLNALVNIFGKSPQKIIDEFDGNYTQAEFVSSGDVKYHKGYACLYQTATNTTNLYLAFNPSHLEYVNPVVQGMVRANQDSKGTDAVNKMHTLGIIVHGDAALTGLGINQGILNMSQTRAYSVGGTIHIVINNQIGFTNSSQHDSRSTHYCTDIAKMIDMPVIHCNGNSITDIMFAADLAVAYRQQFAKDIMLDLVCFRKHGHNEADDPTITQPIMYQTIKQQETVRAVYVAAHHKNTEQANDILECYRQSFAAGKHPASAQMIPLPRYNFTTTNVNLIDWRQDCLTAISSERITKLGSQLTTVPDNFTAHPTIMKLIETRNRMLNGMQSVDFGMAETLAYAALLSEGINIRLTGEDSCRGTFTHRHAVWHDNKIESVTYCPLQHISSSSKFAIYDSVLNEECVLGFEYGYSLQSITNLVLWEAQFGDFANGAQVIIDQFIVSGRAKWGNLSKLVLLLPHSFIGQGPEHSSARLERFLQLAAEHNIRIVIPTTAAQLFHILRIQAKTEFVCPLILFISQKLLRSKDAASELVGFTATKFSPIIMQKNNRLSVTRIILCAGQVYYDIYNAISNAINNCDHITIIRIEQLYPFPDIELMLALAEYPSAVEFLWVQEEPYNQGAWLIIAETLNKCLHKLSPSTSFYPITRPAAAATACGTLKMHNEQLQEILTTALNKVF